MDQTGEANAAAVVSPAAAAPAPTAAAATASAAVVSPAAAASAASPAKASGVVISRHKNSILVSGSTFRHKNVLSSLGGRWNKPLKGWIFGGGKRDAVFDGLRAVPGITITDRTAGDQPTGDGGGAAVVPTTAAEDDFSDLATLPTPNKGIVP